MYINIYISASTNLEAHLGQTWKHISGVEKINTERERKKAWGRGGGDQ